MYHRLDPGPCPICGAAHTACTADAKDTAIAIPQLPQRDAAARDDDPPYQGAGVVRGAPPPPLEAERVQATLGPEDFTSGTYRGSKGKR